MADDSTSWTFTMSDKPVGSSRSIEKKRPSCTSAARPAGSPPSYSSAAPDGAAAQHTPAGSTDQRKRRSFFAFIGFFRYCG